MEEIRVTDLTQLNEHLYANTWKEDLRRFRSNYAYRGMCCASHSLITSLARLCGAYEKNETHLLRNFRKYAHRDSVPGDSVWNWLALGQHHGLPTRLLDWTFSPYVALHFVTEDLDLDQANITERVLFPGLDGLSRWLTRYYRPNKPAAPIEAARETHR